MADKFDVVVIGSGPAGRKAAQVLNDGGKSVAIVESYGFGGTCPLRGCEPKKLLVEASNTAARFSDMQGNGLEGDVRINWPALMQFNRSFVEPVATRVESYLDHEGIATFFGQAKFVAPRTVEVDDESLEGEYILIAAGAMPRPLSMLGKDYVSSSDEFLEMKEMPSRIVFVGGGFISFELGHLAARAGAEVKILEVFNRPLAPFDPDLVEMLTTASRDMGIELRVNCPVVSVEKTMDAYKVFAGPDGEENFTTDMVVHGAGRVPAIKDLDTEKAGVEAGPKGILVNEYMQSVSNSKVYAAGDAAATPFPLTPVATMEGEAAAHNILHGNEKKVDHYGIPSAVYTYPPLAAVGQMEEDLEREGIKYKKIFKDTSRWTEHKRIGLKHAGFKLLIDEERDRVLGAHILGERSEEIINVFALAMQHGLKLEQIKNTLWSYPSFIYNLQYIFR